MTITFDQIASVFSGLIEAICVHHQGKTVYVNSAFEELTGYALEDLAEIKLFDLIIDARESADAKERIANDDTKYYCLNIRTKSGAPIKIMVAPEMTEIDGKLYRVVGLEEVEDIQDELIDAKVKNKQMRALHYATVKALGSMMEGRDPYTVYHQENVALIARCLAVELGLTEQEIEDVYIGSLLHDIGKNFVPTEILVKPTKLNDNEWEMLKAHSANGHRVVADVPFSKVVKDIILHHHERQDGSGYPDGLTAKDISVTTAIVAVADSMDALSTVRPYHAGVSMEEAAELLIQQPDKYSADVLAVLKKCLEEGHIKAAKKMLPAYT